MPPSGAVCNYTKTFIGIGGVDHMEKTDILNNIATKLWDDELIDQNNYNYDFQEFRRDFLKICTAELDGIIFVQGEIIN